MRERSEVLFDIHKGWGTRQYGVEKRIVEKDLLNACAEYAEASVVE
jgi:hypothetical protein